jgi:hypothetical protein
MKGIKNINLYIREVNVPDFVKQTLFYIKVLVDRDTIIVSTSMSHSYNKWIFRQEVTKKSQN